MKNEDRPSRNFWICLGREVTALVPATLRPTRKELAVAARTLGISQVDARRAFDTYTWM